MHVNYVENTGLPLAQSLPWCAAAGYQGVELRDRDRAGKLPIDVYLHEAFEAATAAGLGVVFNSRNDTTHQDPSVRQRSMKDALAVLAFAGQRDIKVLNVFGGAILPPGCQPARFEQTGSNVATPEHWQWTAAYMRDLADAAAQYDILLCLETHNGYIHDLAEPTLRLLDQIDRPNVQVNLDFGNIHLHPNQQGMAKELNLLAGRIGYVHVKNLISFRHLGSPLFFCTPLRDGDINHRVLLRKLLDSGYDGIFTTENTVKGDKQHLIEEDLAYLKSIVHEVAGAACPSAS